MGKHVAWSTEDCASAGARGSMPFPASSSLEPSRSRPTREAPQASGPGRKGEQEVVLRLGRDRPAFRQLSPRVIRPGKEAHGRSLELTQLAHTSCRQKGTSPLKPTATTGGLLGLSLLPRYVWWLYATGQKSSGCPTMQPDQIILVGAGAITFGWYAVLHWAVGLL